MKFFDMIFCMIIVMFFSFTGMIGMEKSPSLPEGLHKSEKNSFLNKAKRSHSEPHVTTTRRSPIDPTEEDMAKSSLKSRPRWKLTSDEKNKKI